MVAGSALSASDLMRFMDCPHASGLDLAHLDGRAPEPAKDTEDAALLHRQGGMHEAAYLARLDAEGREVVRIETEGVPFEEAANATRDVLRRGPDIVFQGALEGGMWGGYADFLERVPLPSQLGQFSYEVVDTKLKRKPAPAHVLQLVLYSDLLEGVQGHAPENAHVELGTGARFSFRLQEYAAYARAARERLEGFVETKPATRPVPWSACDLCRWRDHCAEVWREEDSLYLTAGITRGQAAKLEAAGITSMEALSRHQGSVPKLAGATLEKLRAQAELQHLRKTAEPAYVLRPHVPGKGFDLMPRPDAGDLFYDIEGDPFYSESGSDGLEYLHGVWDGKAFTGFWSHDLAGEKTALITLFELFEKRIGDCPGMHIYHYAPYEITALRQADHAAWSWRGAA